MSEFTPFPKIARLNRACVITEKIDGTNASVFVGRMDQCGDPGIVAPEHYVSIVGEYFIAAGSRTRWIKPGDDNFGFAGWVEKHAEELLTLGPGHHFGEWWGVGIQRGYGLTERRFSLFNTARWSDSGKEVRPECCHVVPVLYSGLFNTNTVQLILHVLAEQGSNAAPGFMTPEGIVVYHTAANLPLKVTIKGDEQGKEAEAHPRKERAPRQPRDPNKGGRRVGLVPIDFPDRRKTA